MRSRFVRFAVLLPVVVSAAAVLGCGPALAAEEPGAATLRTVPPGVDAATLTDADRYCRNIADAAADARAAWQARKLRELEEQVEARLVLLEAKQAEFADWVRRREALLASAEEGVVAIYGRMRPDAAARQLTSMDGDVAAAILAKLNARVASAILNEMEPARAAGLADTISGARSLPAGGKGS
ncbi:MotE family protein [Faunimonas sp. B44]|uniref:MotE family protein n=1 Tax=Faunimonas sp. B44 TaxID=3461493 RepID=UPI004043FA9E